MNHTDQSCCIIVLSQAVYDNFNSQNRHAWSFALAGNSKEHYRLSLAITRFSAMAWTISPGKTQNLSCWIGRWTACGTSGNNISKPTRKPTRYHICPASLFHSHIVILQSYPRDDEGPKESSPVGLLMQLYGPAPSYEPLIELCSHAKV